MSKDIVKMLRQSRRILEDDSISEEVRLKKVVLIHEKYFKNQLIEINVLLLKERTLFGMPSKYEILNPQVEKLILSEYRRSINVAVLNNSKVSDYKITSKHDPSFLIQHRHNFLEKISLNGELKEIDRYNTLEEEKKLLDELEGSNVLLFSIWQSVVSVRHSFEFANFEHSKTYQHYLKILSRKHELDFLFPKQSVKEEPAHLTKHFLNPEKDIPFIIQMCKDLDFITNDKNERWISNNAALRGVIDALIENKRVFAKIYPVVKSVYLDFAKRFGLEHIYKKVNKNNSPYKTAKTKTENYLNTYR